MELYLNRLRSVQHRDRNGRQYLVSPVTPMKSMTLHRGYVPTAEIENSQASWNGTPLSLGHPTNSAGDARPIAHSPETENAYRIGTLFNTGMDGDTLTGEAWINIEAARSKGSEGETIINRLERGDPVSVSTSYFGDQLDAGRYDGKRRTEVIGNLRPDHLALLPNSEGRCSIDDGCMAGSMAANSASSPEIAEAQTLTIASLPESGKESVESTSNTQTATPTMSNTNTIPISTNTNDGPYEIRELWIDHKQLRRALISNSQSAYGSRDTTELIRMNDEEILRAANEQGVDAGKYAEVIATGETVSEELAANAHGNCSCGGSCGESPAVNVSTDSSRSSRSNNSDPSAYPALSMNARLEEREAEESGSNATHSSNSRSTGAFYGGKCPSPRAGGSTSSEELPSLTLNGRLDERGEN